jgi:hypothetical protein
MELDCSLSLHSDPVESPWRRASTAQVAAPSTDAGLELDSSLDFSLGMLHDLDTAKPAAGEPNLSQAATNPVAPLIQLQFQNNFIGESKAGSGYSNTFVVQPVIPWKIGSRQMISRITFPLLIATADLGEPIGREYGVGDTVAINFANFPVKDEFWGGTFAMGVGLTFPTASNDLLGEGKYQAGPGMFYINTSTPHIQWGGLVYQQWSFASAGGESDRPEVSKLFFQPLLNWHFAPGWYTGLGDILWSIDWNDNDRWSIPLSARLGHVTKFGHQPVNMFVEPFYDISGNNKGNEWGVKLSLTLLFPE